MSKASLNTNISLLSVTGFNDRLLAANDRMKVRLSSRERGPLIVLNKMVGLNKAKIASSIFIKCVLV